MIHTILLTLLFTYTNVPVNTMRNEPSHESKPVSQSYYSEPVTIIKEQGPWSQIRTPDNYEGWVPTNTLYQTDAKFLDNQGVITAMINRKSAHLYPIKDTEWGPILTLPFESRLEVVDQFGDPNGRWLQVRLLDDTLAYIQRGDVILNPKPLTLNEALAFSKFFLDLPYTWGGRTSFGYDCSGFVQMIYRQMGITTPRDSSQMALWDGMKDISIDQLQPGDLIFFGKQPNKVTHVGIFLGNAEFIHSGVYQNRPYIQISNLNEPYWNGSGMISYRLARTLKI